MDYGTKWYREGYEATQGPNPYGASGRRYAAAEWYQGYMRARMDRKAEQCEYEETVQEEADRLTDSDYSY